MGDDVGDAGDEPGIRLSFSVSDILLTLQPLGLSSEYSL